MKSIYDEALQELKDATTDLKDLEIIHSYDVNKIEKALVIAKKEHELLELYKELSKYVDEQTYAHELSEITILRIKIKEIENDK